jgi:outer membrane protein TolC
MFKDRYSEGYEAARAEARLALIEGRLATLEKELELLKRLLERGLVPLLEGPK